MSSEKNTILYIDDEPINLKVFTANFDDYYNIITLLSTKGAEEILQNHPVKVLVTDQRMPEETGIDFIKRINPNYPHIIKIILTAYSDQNTALEAINEAGIHKYLLKPWKHEEVKDTIDAAIREFNLQYEKRILLEELQKKNEALSSAYRKLEANERKFYAVFSNSNDGKYILNQRKEIIEANRAFLKMMGFDDKNSSLKVLNTYIHDKFPELLNKPFELANDPHSSIAELEINIQPEEHKFIEINSNQLVNENEPIIFSIIRDISERRLFEKKIVEAIIQTQEEEQSKYARELHDGLGPLLSTLKMHMEWIANPDNTLNKEKIIRHAINTIDLAITSTKEIANNLSPHILQRFGVVNAISSYIEHIKESSNIECILSSNLNERLKSSTETILYRIILECLNNSLKHSRANKIKLNFNKQNQNLMIDYSDNGVGFDVEKEISEGRGMGLFNMQNRIKHINGKFKITSDHSGTSITITIPLN